MKKEGKTPRSGSRRSRIVEPDLDAAFDRAFEELDAARSGGSQAELHHTAKVLRAVITASEMEDAERIWS